MKNEEIEKKEFLTDGYPIKSKLNTSLSNNPKAFVGFPHNLCSAFGENTNSLHLKVDVPFFTSTPTMHFFPTLVYVTTAKKWHSKLPNIFR